MRTELLLPLLRCGKGRPRPRPCFVANLMIMRSTFQTPRRSHGLSMQYRYCQDFGRAGTAPTVALTECKRNMSRSSGTRSDYMLDQSFHHVYTVLMEETV